MKKESSKLEKKYSSLKKDYHELLAEKDKLKELNYDLQTKVIESAEERANKYYWKKNSILPVHVMLYITRDWVKLPDCTQLIMDTSYPMIFNSIEWYNYMQWYAMICNVIEKQMKEAETTPMAHAQDLPVGRKRRNNDIHLGNGVFIEENSLSNVLCCSFTPSKFVGNLLVAKFSEPLLISSTRTGRISNKTLGNLNNKPNLDTNKPVPNKLEPTILGDCKLYYGFWLNTHYLESLSERKKKGFKYSCEYKQFNNYVSTKISNLKKPKDKSKRKGKKQELSGDKKDDHHQDNDILAEANVEEADVNDVQETAVAEKEKDGESLATSISSMVFVGTNDASITDSEISSSELVSEEEDLEIKDPLMDEAVTSSFEDDNRAENSS